jgi:phosphoribosylaminoimidazole-succinocarboxamide synthase
MLTTEQITKQLNYTITGLKIPDADGFYSGKVRECYSLKSALSGEKRILIATDRLSAFDVILTTVPFKGALLSQMAAYWFNETKNLVPNHVLETPHPNVFVCEEVDIIPIEVVVRGYLTGSAWRDYTSGNSISGVTLQAGKKKNEKFSVPIITPSTKAEIGKHDIPISGRELVTQGVVEQKVWDEVTEKALALFDFGTKRAEERGLILVDTKYEFGLRKGTKEVVLADEIHTQDSSRYWELDSYNSRFDAGQEPQMLDKEFVRTWLIERDYMGNGEAPEITEEFRVETAIRYMQAYEKITGKSFEHPVGSQVEKITEVVKSYF